MDWNYGFSFISFLIGLAAGFQGIYDRYQKDSATASFTPPGLFYLLSRGIVPASVFAGLYANRIIESNLFFLSLACGTGAELVLRTRFFVRQSQKDGVTEELSRGPFDLLRWYQNLFLESIAEHLAISRKKFVQEQLPEGVNFPTLCDRVVNNLGAWPDARAVTELDTAIARLRTEFQTESQTAGTTALLQEKYRLKLGYLLLNKVGRNGFKTLLSA